MSAFLKALFQKYARRVLMGKGEGITRIPPKSIVDEFAKDIYKNLKKLVFLIS